MLTEGFNFGGNLAYRRLSINAWAFSLNAFLAPWLSSLRKSGNFMVFGSNTKLCHLCLAVAWDSGLTYFRRNTARMSSKVCLFAVIMLRKVCRAFFRNNEWNRFCLHCFSHIRLHFNHCVKEIFEKFNFLWFSVKRQCSRTDWAYHQRMCGWAVNHAD